VAEIRAVVADDEPLARRGILQLAAEHGDVVVVGEASNGAEAVRLLRELSPDLVFLDVEMPEMDGFGVLLHQTDPPPLVVFVTAYEDFALRAFDVNAADYLLKPVSSERFAICMDRVRERLGHPTLAGSVVVQDRRGRHVIRAEEIEWVDAQDYYASVHVAGRSFLVRESLASLEARLPGDRFMRVHRSALVNLGQVRSFLPEEGGGGTLVLTGGARVPVSRRSRSGVQERLRRRR
jgi:two-component system LytT family response regulator